MAWSLLNHMIADKVEALLKEQDAAYGPEVRRFYSREQAASIIHAVLWGYGVRDDSTAGVYAAHNLFTALGLKWQCFDEQSAEWARNSYNANLRARHARDDAASEPQCAAGDLVTTGVGEKS